MATPLVIDCDPGVDDAIAILLALASPEVELLALTTVAGNLPLETTTRNALAVLALAGREDVPVAAGAARPLVVRRDRDAAVVHGADGLGGAPVPESSAAVVPMHAVDLLAEILERSDEPVLLAPVGPLTNIALLAALRPELLPSIGRVSVMGGGDGLGNVTPAAEFNIWFDPECGRARVRLRPRPHDGRPQRHARRDALRPRRRPHPRHRRRSARSSPRCSTTTSTGRPSSTATAACPSTTRSRSRRCSGPSLVTTVDALVTVDTTAGPARGMTLVDRHRWDGQEPNARVAIDTDRDAFVELLCERLASLDGG